MLCRTPHLNPITGQTKSPSAHSGRVFVHRTIELAPAHPLSRIGLGRLNFQFDESDTNLWDALALSTPRKLPPVIRAHQGPLLRDAPLRQGRHPAQDDAIQSAKPVKASLLSEPWPRRNGSPRDVTSNRLPGKTCVVGVAIHDEFRKDGASRTLNTIWILACLVKPPECESAVCGIPSILRLANGGGSWLLP